MRVAIFGGVNLSKNENSFLDGIKLRKRECQYKEWRYYWYNKNCQEIRTLPDGFDSNRASAPLKEEFKKKIRG